MRRFLIPIILLAIVLAGCQGSIPAATEKPAETESIQVTESPPETPVKTEAPEVSPTSSEEAALTDSPPPGCTVVSRQPTPGPTEQSLFPPASEEDWVKGPDDAAITIIEYGDYQ